MGKGGGMGCSGWLAISMLELENDDGSLKGSVAGRMWRATGGEGVLLVSMIFGMSCVGDASREG